MNCEQLCLLARTDIATLAGRCLLNDTAQMNPLCDTCNVLSLEHPECAVCISSRYLHTVATAHAISIREVYMCADAFERQVFAHCKTFLGLGTCEWRRGCSLLTKRILINAKVKYAR